MDVLGLRAAKWSRRISKRIVSGIHAGDCVVKAALVLQNTAEQ
jgi:hypothetical protein